MNLRVKALEEKVSRLETLRGKLQEDLTAMKAEVEHLSTEIEVLTKVEELFRVLMDLLVVKQVRVIEEVITEGFQTILYDQNLHFESEISTKYNKISIDFLIREGDASDPIVIRGKPTSNFGGGAVSIASVILRVLALFRLKKFPLLLLDESLAAVSDEYIDETSRWLRAMASKMGIPILLVTHKRSYTDHCDLAYLAYKELDLDSRKRVGIKVLSAKDSL
jgi:ABC-type branched-subunit amino acid transport system ATPase component